MAAATAEAIGAATDVGPRGAALAAARVAAGRADSPAAAARSAPRAAPEAGAGSVPRGEVRASGPRVVDHANGPHAGASERAGCGPDRARTRVVRDITGPDAGSRLEPPTPVQ